MEKGPKYRKKDHSTVGPFAFTVVGLAQISAVNEDTPTYISVVSRDIPAH